MLASASHRNRDFPKRTQNLAEKGTARVNRYLTTEEVAELCRTTPGTVRWWRHVNRGPRSFRLGKRVLYDVADVEAFIAEARSKVA
jgi:predicted DNA-binding transcriptional regulator AlpA